MQVELCKQKYFACFAAQATNLMPDVLTTLPHHRNNNNQCKGNLTLQGSSAKRGIGQVLSIEVICNSWPQAPNSFQQGLPKFIHRKPCVLLIHAGNSHARTWGHAGQESLHRDKTVTSASASFPSILLLKSQPHFDEPTACLWAISKATHHSILQHRQPSPHCS